MPVDIAAAVQHKPKENKLLWTLQQFEIIRIYSLAGFLIAYLRNRNIVITWCCPPIILVVQKLSLRVRSSFTHFLNLWHPFSSEASSNWILLLPAFPPYRFSKGYFSVDVPYSPFFAGILFQKDVWLSFGKDIFWTSSRAVNNWLDCKTFPLHAHFWAQMNPRKNFARSCLMILKPC